MSSSRDRSHRRDRRPKRGAGGASSPRDRTDEVRSDPRSRSSADGENTSTADGDQGKPRAVSAQRSRLGWTLAALCLAVLLSSAAAWLYVRRGVVQNRLDVLAMGGEVEVRQGGWPWLNSILDPRYFEEVVSVRLHNVDLTPNDAAKLQAFAELEELFLHQSRMTNDVLREVAKLGRLRLLNLISTDVTADGLVHLRELPRLERIWIGPHATNRELKALAQIESLKEINVMFSPEVDDEGLAELEKLESLENLRMADSAISPSAVESFRRSRPDVNFPNAVSAASGNGPTAGGSAPTTTGSR